MTAERFVLALDVGWSTLRRSSAACLLSWDDRRVQADIVRFTAHPDDYRPALSRLIGARRLDAAAFDGPLRGDLAEIGTYRAAEMILTRRLARHIGKPGQSNSPNGRLLNRMANRFAMELMALAAVADGRHAAAIHARAIVEAFPTAFLGTMLDRGFRREGQARSDSYYMALTGDQRGDRLAALVHRLLPGRAPAFAATAVRNHDDRAALVCAITALCVAMRRYTAVGDRDGWIILPPRAENGIGLSDWAWALLAQNAGELGSGLREELGESDAGRGC